MNKLTSTLAGLAVLAAVSAVPASAQTFTANGPFTFSLSPTTFSVNDISASFNPMNGPAETGTLSIIGGTSTNGTDFTGSTLTFLTGGSTVSESIPDVFVNPIAGTGTDFISGFAPPAGFSSGFTLALEPGTPNSSPVPEASTVLSFGALLALGGLAVLRRKTVAKSAA